MSQSGSGITDKGVTAIPDSTEIRGGDSLRELSKRIEIVGEKIDVLSSEISELKRNNKQKSYKFS